MFAEEYHQDILRQLRKYKALGEAAMAQVSDEQLLAAPGAESNSIGLIVKHMAGNMRSRWRDFLTSDGEKPDRDRDREFVQAGSESRESVLQQWQEGWSCTFAALEGLQPADFTRMVTIRGEAHSVLQAINRQVTHYAYHVGQIVYLAKHHAGENWQSLSIPRGRSRDFEVSKEGQPYRPPGETGGA